MVRKKKAVDPEDSGQPEPEAKKEEVSPVPEAKPEKNTLVQRVESLEKQLNVIRAGCPHAAACFKGGK